MMTLTAPVSTSQGLDDSFVTPSGFWVLGWNPELMLPGELCPLTSSSTPWIFFFFWSFQSVAQPSLELATVLLP